LVDERRTAQEPDHRHRRLLTARRERPRSRRAAEHHDELAPFVPAMGFSPYPVQPAARILSFARSNRPVLGHF